MHSFFCDENISSPPTNKDFSYALLDIFDLLKDLKVNNSFRVFEDKEDIRHWSVRHYSAWEQQLTQEEVKNIKLYTSCSFKYNEHLRQNKYPRYKNRILHIDSALEKASTPENVITFRWIDLEGLQRLASCASIHSGTKFLEKGYSSTTLFFNGSIEYSGDVLFILIVPKNYNGACLKNISNIKAEDELLLKRNSVYTVDKIIYYTDTNVILLCNVQ